jgi:eukaryotic-like serine/threonine-protein kinase
VVPPAPAPAPHVAEAPTGKIGGRAMLAPGELPTDRRQPPAAPAAPVAVPPAATSPGLPALPAGPLPAPGSPTALPAPPAALPGSPVGGPATYRAHAAHAARLGPVARFRRLSVPAGLAAVVLVAVVGAASMFSGGLQPKATPHAAPSPTGPPFPVQAFTDSQRGFALEVPAGWTKLATGSYFDFVDPADSGRTLRVNVERAGGTAEDFIKAVAREQAKSPTKCPTPFTEVAEREVTLAGRPAAELEYTCGQGTDMRHVLWRATVLGGKAYEFRLTVADSKFAESRVIYEHAAESYHLNKPS